MSKKWTADELILTVDAYLDGQGIKEKTDRSRKSVASVIRSKLPRNYRNCISWMDSPAAFERRVHKGWSMLEDKYLAKLIRNKRTLHEIMVIIGRNAKQIDERARSFTPTQPGEGFGFTSKGE